MAEFNEIWKADYKSNGEEFKNNYILNNNVGNIGDVDLTRDCLFNFDCNITAVHQKVKVESLKDLYKFCDENSININLNRILEEGLKIGKIDGCLVINKDLETEFIWEKCSNKGKSLKIIEDFKKVVNKYGFQMTQDDNTLILIAKTTSDENVYWIKYNIDTKKASCLGNTDQCCIWFCDTRPDLDAEKIIQFARDLNSALELKDDDRFLIKELIDPEDWQKIANTYDAYSDFRYIEIDENSDIQIPCIISKKYMSDYYDLSVKIINNADTKTTIMFDKNKKTISIERYNKHNENIKNMNLYENEVDALKEIFTEN